MPEAALKQLTHAELATLLIKELGIHEGIWSVAAELQFGAMTIDTDDQSMYPTGLVSIKAIGLAPATKENNIAVDAARVNPKPKKAKVKTQK